MQSAFIFLFLCGLAVLAWWMLLDADRFVEEDEEGVGDNEKAEAAQEEYVLEGINDGSDSS
jgi:hypothetical protein